MNNSNEETVVVENADAAKTSNEAINFTDGYIGEVARVAGPVNQIINFEDQKIIEASLRALSSEDLCEIRCVMNIGHDGVAEDSTLALTYENLKKEIETDTDSAEIIRQMIVEQSLEEFQSSLKEGLRLCKEPVKRKTTPFVLAGAAAVLLLLGVGFGVVALSGQGLVDSIADDAPNTETTSKEDTASSKTSGADKSDTKKTSEADKKDSKESDKDSTESKTEEDKNPAKDKQDSGSTNNGGSSSEGGSNNNGGGSSHQEPAPATPAHVHEFQDQFGDSQWVTDISVTGYRCSSCGWVGDSIAAVGNHQDQSVIDANYQGGCMGGIGEVITDNSGWGTPPYLGRKCNCGTWE